MPDEPAAPNPRRYANDRLGRIAQEHVGWLAECAELNKSAAGPDVDGWDFHLTVPRDRPLDGSSFFDSDPPRTAAFVQVKGTTTKKRRQGIALSHWKHAATMPLPWFFIVLEYDAPPTPARMFIVHMDAPLIEQVARRLRELGVDSTEGVAPALHTKTMDLTWDVSHLVACDPGGLRSTLLKHAGDDIAVYADRKKTWWRNAGGSTVQNRLKLVLKAPREQNDRRLSDWALGQADKLRVDELHRTELKWGIPRDFEPEANAVFEPLSPLGKSSVRIRDAAGSEHVELTADVYCNVCIFPFLPRELWAIRIVTGFLEIVVRATARGVEIRFHIPQNQPPVELASLAAQARAIRLLSAASVLTYSVPLKNRAQEYTHEIAAVRVEMPGVEMLDAMEAAWTLCTLFKLPPQFSIAPATIEEWAEELVEFGLANTSSDIRGEIEFGQSNLPEGDQRMALWFAVSRLGEYWLIAALAVEGPVRWVEGRATIKGSGIVIRRWTVFGEDKGWRRTKFPRLVEQLVVDLENKGTRALVADGELARLVAEVRAGTAHTKGGVGRRKNQRRPKVPRRR